MESDQQLERHERIFAAALLGLIGGVTDEVALLFSQLRVGLQSEGAHGRPGGDVLRQFENETAGLAATLNGATLDAIGRYLIGPDGQPVIPSAAPGALQQQLMLIEQVHTLVQRATEMSRIAATPGVAPSLILSSMIGAGEQLSVTRAFDASVVRIAGLNTLSSGRGIFTRKLAVPTLDSHTTDLCRNRMAWQEKGLQEPYVDPVTGAAWMSPPFIYNGLPREEEFHLCRTISILR